MHIPTPLTLLRSPSPSLPPAPPPRCSPRCCWAVVTCDRAGGRPGMQGHVRLGDGLWVQPWDLLQFGEGHDGLAALRRRGGHQQGLLGGHRGWGQVRGPDLLCHQLLLDFIDQNQVVQLGRGKQDAHVTARGTGAWQVLAPRGSCQPRHSTGEGTLAPTPQLCHCSGAWPLLCKSTCGEGKGAPTRGPTSATAWGKEGQTLAGAACVPTCRGAPSTGRSCASMWP